MYQNKNNYVDWCKDKVDMKSTTN